MKSYTYHHPIIKDGLLRRRLKSSSANCEVLVWERDPREPQICVKIEYTHPILILTQLDRKSLNENQLSMKSSPSDHSLHISALLGLE